MTEYSNQKMQQHAGRNHSTQQPENAQQPEMQQSRTQKMQQHSGRNHIMQQPENVQQAENAAIQKPESAATQKRKSIQSNAETQNSTEQ